MRVLLDTHALYWAAFAPPELSASARALLESEETIAVVSMVSLWEMAIKQSIGKLKIPIAFFAELPNHGYELIGIGIRHIDTYVALPMHHRDPFDRMLVAQSQCEQMSILTRDPEICQYDVRTIQA